MGCLVSSGVPFTAIPPLRICPSSLGQAPPGSGPDLGAQRMFVPEMVMPDGNTSTGRWQCWHPGAFCLTASVSLSLTFLYSRAQQSLHLTFLPAAPSAHFQPSPVLAQTPSQHTLYSLLPPKGSTDQEFQLLGKKYMFVF